MAMDEATVARLAQLTSMQIGSAEAAALAAELDGLIGWLDQLQAVDIDAVEPMRMVVPTELVWRADAVTDGDMAREVLANAPQSAHGFFTVPKVIE